VAQPILPPGLKAQDMAFPCSRRARNANHRIMVEHRIKALERVVKYLPAKAASQGSDLQGLAVHQNVSTFGPAQSGA
jgi:hypothetical protein